MDTVLRGKFITLNGYIKKEKYLKSKLKILLQKTGERTAI